jgi:DNA-binding NarL/FixJ family response regulator
LHDCRAAGASGGRAAKDKQHLIQQSAHMDTTQRATPLTVFLVEDSLAIRARLAATIRGIEGTELVGEAGTVGGAIDGIRSTHPRALILDLQLEDGSGLEVLRAVHPAAPALHVAVLTNYATDQHRRACMDAGAECFLDKSSDFPRIREIVQGWTAGHDGATAGH